MSNKFSRRTTVINPKLQWHLALRNVVCMGVFLVATLSLGLIGQFLSTPNASAAENLNQYISQNVPTILAMVCLVPVFVRDSLQTSHRFAGPIFKLAQTCERIADGDKDVPELKFRKDDMWKEVAVVFNEMVEKLREDGAPKDCCDVSERGSTSHQPAEEEVLAQA